MKIYYCSTVDGFDYASVESLINNERLLRTRRLPQNKQASSFTAGLLIRYALQQEGIPYGSITLLPSGKPHIDYEGWHISVSHSANHTICALSTCPVGVDIQVITLPRERLIRRVCSQEEQQYIHSSPCVATAFTTLWVLKESYVKLLGCGIGTDLAAISFKVDGNFAHGPEGYTFSLSYEVDDAVIGLCTKEVQA